MSDLQALIERANSIHEKIAAEVPQLRRGMVWCYTCGREVCDRFERATLDLTPLIGKDLVCFCKPARCHGDSILAAIRLGSIEPEGSA